MSGRRIPIVLVSAVAALALVEAAAAHGPTSGASGYVSSVSSLRPPVLRVLVNVLGNDDRLQLVNYSAKPIEVLGYDREPFLRFTGAAVYENAGSPTTYLSRERDPAAARVPASADPKAPPRWRKVTAGSTFAWHDRRIRWNRSEPPAVVQDAPGEIHRVLSWRIPARAGGKPFAITGFLGFRPPPPVESGTST